MMDIRKTIGDSTGAASEKLGSLKPSLRNMNKRNRRRAAFSLIVLGNLILLVLIAGFLSVNKSASQTVRNSLASSAVATTNSKVTPLDQISSAEIAMHTAQVTNLPELTAVRNQAQSEALLLATVPNDSTILASPQIVSTSQKSRYQIIFYKVKPGETASSIAAKFRLSASSVTASNNLAGDYVSAGTTLAIPPANGVVYKVASGDTVSSIVSAYGADKRLFISVNDAENGVYANEYVWIPNVSGAASSGYSSFYTSSGFAANYGFNGYDYGFCTWYVAAKIAVPSNWGNAYTWDDYARITPGWTVSLSPKVGAIAQSDSMSYLGHVAVVEAVSADGSMIKFSDMNNLAGWGKVGYSDWASTSTFQHYIYR